MTNFPPHPFWIWSLEVYGRPGVEEILLDLQDRLNLDINLLLFACWAGATGRGRLAGVDWDRLIGGTARWRADVVAPLRAVRRHLKDCPDIPGAMALREKVKALELEAEYTEQMTIVGLAGDMNVLDIVVSERMADADANLRSCMVAAGLSPSAVDRAVLNSLARGCCGGPQTRD